jgi:hypothetical protein
MEDEDEGCTWSMRTLMFTYTCHVMTTLWPEAHKNVGLQKEVDFKRVCCYGALQLVFGLRGIFGAVSSLIPCLLYCLKIAIISHCCLLLVYSTLNSMPQENSYTPEGGLEALADALFTHHHCLPLLVISNR